MAKKILVADDEDALANALRIKLTKAGYEVVVAHDGEDALGKVREHKPDLILLDLVMPVLDGFGVLEKLQEQENQVPVYVTSNLSQVEDSKRAEELGAQKYFIKSNTSLSEIVEYIQEHLVNEDTE